MSRYTTIRRARPSDSDELTRIAHAAKRHWGYSEQLIRLWEPDLTLRPGFVARQPAYCAVERSRPVAFYALSGRGRCRELEHMWVHPRRIGSGVGTLLFAHLINRLRLMGVTRLRIASDPNADIKVQIFVYAPYDSQVYDHTHFWKASGITFDAGPSGFRHSSPML